MSKQQNRSHWSKLSIPPELAEILRGVAITQGYDADKQYLLLYHMLKAQYPEETQGLATVYKAGWLDTISPD